METLGINEVLDYIFSGNDSETFYEEVGNRYDIPAIYIMITLILII